MTTARQQSMSRGEVGEAMYARVDTVDYSLGLRTLRNFRILRQGGAENRSGFRFCDETRYPTKKSRLIRFIFNVSAGNTYQIELGDLYAEFIQSGARIVEASQGITAISKANPAVVTYVGADTYANGDDVVITGGDMPEIIGRRFRVKNLNAGANTFELTHTDNSNLDSTAFTAYTAGAVVAKIYKVVTPYLEAELSAITYDQSADVVTMCHPSHPMQDLTRLGSTNWTVTEVINNPAQPRPDNGSCTGSAGAEFPHYRVTTISLAGEETGPGRGGTHTVSAMTNANPGVFTTSSNHFLITDDEIRFFDIPSVPEVNSTYTKHQYFLVTVLSPTTFKLRKANVLTGVIADVDTTAFGVFAAGPYTNQVATTSLRPFTGVAAASAGTPVTVSWQSQPKCSGFRIYKRVNPDGVYGFIGSCAWPTYSFQDLGTPVPDVLQQPPIGEDFFGQPGDYPACIAYSQQRRIVGRTNNAPTTWWASQVGYFTNFTALVPNRDSNSIVLPLPGSQVSEIKHLIELSQLILFTASGEMMAKGDSSGILKPDSPNVRTQSRNGIGEVAPIIADANMIFVQRDGSIVRDCAFDYRVDGFVGKDLTTRSSHLFDGRTITSMAFQKAPIQTVFCVRDDGTLLAMTYLREEELVGWSRLDTSGVIESVSSIPEGGEEAVYVIVKRTRSGPGATTRRYVERLNRRLITDIKDAFFVDAGLTYDGRNLGATTMTLTGGPPWTSTTNLTLTASAAFFSASDVGNSIFLTGSDGTLIRCKIQAYTSSTVVTVKPHKTVPASMQAVAITTWSKAVYQIGGLWHLEGRQVAVLGDGGVVASPKTALLTVANGRITLPGNTARAVIQIGLPYYSDLQTLDIDRPDQEAKAGRMKLVGSVLVHVANSIGGFVGGAPPSNDAVDPKEGLDELDYKDVDTLVDADPVTSTEVVDEDIQGRWNDNGRVFIRQMDPLPLTVLAVMPTGLLDG